MIFNDPSGCWTKRKAKNVTVKTLNNLANSRYLSLIHLVSKQMKKYSISNIDIQAASSYLSKAIAL